jgi:hypothetical protein
LATGSSTESLPSSWSISTAAAVNGLVIEAIQKMLSGRMRFLAAASACRTCCVCKQQDKDSLESGLWRGRQEMLIGDPCVDVR